MRHLILYCALLLITVLVGQECHSMHPKFAKNNKLNHINFFDDDKNPDKWMKLAEINLKKALNKKKNLGIAKNM